MHNSETIYPLIVHKSMSLPTVSKYCHAIFAEIHESVRGNSALPPGDRPVVNRAKYGHKAEIAVRTVILDSTLLP